MKNESKVVNVYIFVEKVGTMWVDMTEEDYNDLLKQLQNKELEFIVTKNISVKREDVVMVRLKRCDETGVYK